MLRRGTKEPQNSKHVKDKEHTGPTTPKSATSTQSPSSSTPPLSANNRLRKLKNTFSFKSRMESDSTASPESAEPSPTTSMLSTASASEQLYTPPTHTAGARVNTNTSSTPRLVDNSLPADIGTNPPVFSTRLAYTNVEDPEEETLYTPASLLQAMVNYRIAPNPPTDDELGTEVPEPTNPLYYEQTQARRLNNNRSSDPTEQNRVLAFLNEHFTPSKKTQFLDLPTPIMTKIFSYILIYPHDLWPWQYSPRPEVRRISGPPPQVDLFEVFCTRGNKDARRAFDAAKNVLYGNNKFRYATSAHKDDFEKAIGWVNCWRVNGIKMFDPGFGPEDEEIVWAGPVLDEEMSDGWEEMEEGFEEEVEKDPEGIEEGLGAIEEEVAGQVEEQTQNEQLVDTRPRMQRIQEDIRSTIQRIQEDPRSTMQRIQEDGEVMDGDAAFFAQEYIDLITDNWI